MPSFICTTCGVGYAPSDTPPQSCRICSDERQYVNAGGQDWTTLAALQATHENDIRELEPGLFGIGASPQIAIGQRALFIAQPGGGVLWDCTPLVTPEAVAHIEAHGGLRAIAISHPHFYASMVDWSEAFGGIPIHLHADDRAHVMRPSERVTHWTGETLDLGQGITLIRCGGHFAGSSALHWAGGAGGEGVLTTGDTIMVVPDSRWVSFMYSYPNLIPLPARAVARIAGAVAPFASDTIYAGWWDRVLRGDASARVRASADRYIAAIAPE
ncbi:MBL fold metallo-hydrolase [Devosia sp.]|uniref:MBL fold metallo-hydrolase n=1 Tax=Devosia sp. TaxID=1871048 RepID=UPI003A92FBB1